MKPCEICAGNDGDMPCAYPSKCLRDQRRIDELLERVDVLESALNKIADGTAPRCLGSDKYLTVKDINLIAFNGGKG